MKENAAIKEIGFLTNPIWLSPASYQCSPRQDWGLPIGLAGRDKDRRMLSPVPPRQRISYSNKFENVCYWLVSWLVDFVCSSAGRKDAFKEGGQSKHHSSFQNKLSDSLLALPSVPFLAFEAQTFVAGSIPVPKQGNQQEESCSFGCLIRSPLSVH